MKTQKISSGSPWESIVGYSRAVRMESLIEVSGTTATDETGHVVFPGNAYEQTKFIFQKIGLALKEAGASFDHVIRTRMYVTNISLWQEIGRAHAEIFKEIKPASTLVEVKGLIQPELLIEIEVTAVIP